MSDTVVGLMSLPRALAGVWARRSGALRCGALLLRIGAASSALEVGVISAAEFAVGRTPRVAAVVAADEIVWAPEPRPWALGAGAPFVGPGVAVRSGSDSTAKRGVLEACGRATAIVSLADCSLADCMPS